MNFFLSSHLLIFLCIRIYIGVYCSSNDASRVPRLHRPAVQLLKFAANRSREREKRTYGVWCHHPWRLTSYVINFQLTTYVSSIEWDNEIGVECHRRAFVRSLGGRWSVAFSTAGCANCSFVFDMETSDGCVRKALHKHWVVELMVTRKLKLEPHWRSANNTLEKRGKEWVVSPSEQSCDGVFNSQQRGFIRGFLKVSLNRYRRIRQKWEK